MTQAGGAGAVAPVAELPPPASCSVGLKNDWVREDNDRSILPKILSWVTLQLVGKAAKALGNNGS